MFVSHHLCNIAVRSNQRTKRKMKSSILRALTFGINEECPNDTGVAECEADCFNLLTQCQIDCKQDFSCLSDCNREFAECGEVRVSERSKLSCFKFYFFFEF